MPVPPLMRKSMGVNEVMGRWGEPFTETNRYCIGKQKAIVVERIFIDHFPTPTCKIADMRIPLDVQVSGEIGAEDAAAIEQWIIGRYKTEVPIILRDALNLEPTKGED